MGNVIVMYGMNECHLCERARCLLAYWHLKYTYINRKPYKKCDYPYFNIDGKKVKYKELVDMIAKGELKGEKK